MLDNEWIALFVQILFLCHAHAVLFSSDSQAPIKHIIKSDNIMFQNVTHNEMYTDCLFQGCYAESPVTNPDLGCHGETPNNGC